MIAICLLLAVEVLGLTLRYDAKMIMKPGQFSAAAVPGAVATNPQSWVAWLLGQASLVLKASIVAASATAIFGGRRLLEDLKGLSETSFIRWSWPAFLGHIAALGGFILVSGHLLEGGGASGEWSMAWFIAWLGLGVMVVASLAATAIAPSVQRPLVRCLLRAVAVGMAVGGIVAGAGQMATLLWRPLGIWTLKFVHGLLRIFIAHPIYRPSDFEVGSESFSVAIAPQCSGYEGIGMVLAFLGIYVWFFRHHFRLDRAWMLLPLGAVAIWLANVVRIIGLIMVGTWISSDVAVSGFHSQAGWIGFNIVCLGLVAVSSKCSFFVRDDVPAFARSKESSREAVYLAPLLAIVAASMVGGAFSSGAGVDRFYPLRLLAVAIPFWLYRREYAAMRWSVSWQAFAIGVLVFGLWVARWPGGLFAQNPGGGATSGAIGLATALWMTARVIGSCVTVPIAEELAFRGFLTRRLIAADFDTIAPGRFTWFSFLVSSAAFGLLHDRWFEGILAGMLYAIAYYRRGSMGDAVVAHATTNGMLSAGAVITGNWSLWS